ncbi:MAG TPA: hypothetical protein VGT78_02995 [Rhizomicrobium sp.]|nr:hypothetical protein [Rhizomicrobium sp.]
MSDFTNAHGSRTNVRRQLLATVSAIALFGCAWGTAQAGDSDRPLLWLEAGGQWSRMDDGQEVFAPALMAARPSILTPSQKFERMAPYSIDEYGRISFQPENSDWEFSASIRYGRSASDRHVRQQTDPKVFVTYRSNGFGQIHRYAKYPSAAKFADTNAQNSEHHLVLDFQAGKDVGLGMFGKTGSSVVGVGVRFAQFSSKSNIALKSDPDWQFYYKYFAGKNLPLGGTYHSNAASIQAARSFRGVGPSISWNGSAPLMGSPQDSEIAFDWGLNAALLFGRQRAKVHHQTTAQYHAHKYYGSHLRKTVGTPVNTNHTRSRSIVVPNIGGFAGLSFRYADAKVSFGYRADLFLNAMDGGIDARKSENRGFYGPYASISIGLGD